jgi:hypothetical protein
LREDIWTLPEQQNLLVFTTCLRVRWIWLSLALSKPDVFISIVHTPVDS